MAHPRKIKGNAKWVGNIIVWDLLLLRSELSCTDYFSIDLRFAIDDPSKMGFTKKVKIT